MLPLLLIDTRDVPPEPGPPRRPSALVALLSWLYPWPAILAWLFIATMVLDGLPGAIAGYVMLCVAFWRMMKAIPADGLGSHQQ